MNIYVILTYTSNLILSLVGLYTAFLGFTKKDMHFGYPIRLLIGLNGLSGLLRFGELFIIFMVLFLSKPELLIDSKFILELLILVSMFLTFLILSLLSIAISRFCFVKLFDFFYSHLLITAAISLLGFIITAYHFFRLINWMNS